MKYYLTQEGVNFLNETRSDASRLRMILKKKTKKEGSGFGQERSNVGIRDPEGTIQGAQKSYRWRASRSLDNTGGGASARRHKDAWKRMAANDPAARAERVAHSKVDMGQGPTRVRPTGEEEPFWGTEDEAAHHKEKIAAALATIKKSRLLRSVRDAQPHSRRNR